MSSQPTSGNTIQLPALTTKQRAWLKRHWDGEFKFLRAYQLSIYKDEDRLEGREILKALMEADQEEQEAEDTSGDK